jgi:ankyrin repeat protein
MPPSRRALPSLEWLRKRAKSRLADLRRTDRAAKLSAAQLAVAREHGFPSWRALHAAATAQPAAAEPPPEPLVAGFLRSVGSGDLAAVEAHLLERPELIDAVGPHPFWGGRPQALHVAIETNRMPMVKLLLRHGADVNGRNDLYDHWSPLMIAVGERHARVRRMLLRRGARIGLTEALLLGDDRRALRLLGRGRRLPAIPNDGSLLAFARTPRAIDRLLELGASIEQKDRWGATPMEVLSRMGPKGKTLVRHLLKRGIPAGPEVFARLGDRITLERLVAADPAVARKPAVLKAAVDFGHHRLAAWLLDLGADPNGRAGTGADETPLHSAAWNGDLEMVELLLARGADPSLRDHQYDGIPEDWALKATEVTDNQRCALVATRLGAFRTR